MYTFTPNYDIVHSKNDRSLNQVFLFPSLGGVLSSFFKNSFKKIKIDRLAFAVPHPYHLKQILILILSPCHERK